MLTTADTIHDSVTGLDYHRLNLAKAVDAVMHQAVATPPEAAQASAPAAPTSSASQGVAAAESNAPVVAAEPSRVADTTVVDWGTPRQKSFNGYVVGTQGQSFSLSAANDGLLTIEAFSRGANGNVSIELFDAAGRSLGSAAGRNGSARLDATVAAGDRLTLRASTDSSSGDSLDFRVTNLVAQQGKTVQVVGTAQNDCFTFVADATLELSVNGVAYAWDRDKVTDVVFDGQGGWDTASLTGSAGADSLTTRSSSADMTGRGYHVQALSAESIVACGGGGADSATILGSGGSDRLTAGGRRVQVRSASGLVVVDDFRRVRAQTVSRGTKTARVAAHDFVLQLQGSWTRVR